MKNLVTGSGEIMPISEDATEEIRNMDFISKMEVDDFSTGYGDSIYVTMDGYDDLNRIRADLETLTPYVGEESRLDLSDYYGRYFSFLFEDGVWVLYRAEEMPLLYGVG